MYFLVVINKVLGVRVFKIIILMGVFSEGRVLFVGLNYSLEKSVILLVIGVFKKEYINNF